MDVFLECLKSRTETRRVECKGPATKADLLGAIAKAALGFANHRDGGRILIGAAQLPDGTLRPDGLSDEQFSSFRVRDLAGELASYGSPRLRVDCFLVPFEEKRFIGITVLPFRGEVTLSVRSTRSREPVIDRIYVRSDDAIESRPARAEEIAALVEIAVEFRLKEQIERLVRAGVLIVSQELRVNVKEADEEYRRERGEF